MSILDFLPHHSLYKEYLFCPHCEASYRNGWVLGQEVCRYMNHRNAWGGVLWQVLYRGLSDGWGVGAKKRDGKFSKCSWVKANRCGIGRSKEGESLRTGERLFGRGRFDRK